LVCKPLDCLNTCLTQRATADRTISPTRNKILPSGEPPWGSICRCGERELEELGERRGKQKVSETRRKDVSEVRFGSSRNQTLNSDSSRRRRRRRRRRRLLRTRTLKHCLQCSSVAVLIFAFSFFSLLLCCRPGRKCGICSHSHCRVLIIPNAVLFPPPRPP
jgi:hypothetical protein